MNVERVLVWLGLAVLGAGVGCKYEDRPPPGALICGLGSRACPTNYACYRGTVGTNCMNTCWPTQTEPSTVTICTHNGVITDNHPDSGAADADGGIGHLADAADAPVDVPGDQADAGNSGDRGVDSGGSAGPDGAIDRAVGDTPDASAERSDAANQVDSGIDVAPSTLTVNTSTVNFGSVLQGGKSTASTIMVSNNGGVATGAITTTLSLGEFAIATDGCKGTSLTANGDSCAMTLTFSPTSASPTPKGATLTVSATSGESRTVALSGVGTTLQVDQASFVYPAAPVASAGTSRTFTITNPTSGSAGTTLALSLALSGAAAADFMIGSNTCTGALGGTGICTTLVAFHPSSFGLRAATLTVNATPGGATTVALSGQGQAADGQFGCVTENDCQSLACGTFYRDSDGDTFGDINKPTKICGLNPPNGYVFFGSDCDDLDPAMYPGVSRCQSSAVRAYCLDDGILRTQTCTGGGCRDNACVGTVGTAGVVFCYQAGNCTTAQGCTVDPSGPPACGRSGSQILNCDDGSDCPAGSVCCALNPCVAFRSQACSVGGCPAGDSCNHYLQVCNPLAPDCPLGTTCQGGQLVDTVSGQGQWSCF